MSDRKEEILVSVCSITYNHAPYIRECLDGFLMQECDFKYEILIHDDASTDGTQDIIKEYQAKYPEIIKPILQTENQWSKGIRGIHIRYNFPRVKGKYIAMCEGDDYWTDPLKLQRQVDFLDKNQEYIISTENAFIKDTQRNHIKLFYEINVAQEDISINSLLEKRKFTTASVLFRNIPIALPYGGDIVLWIYLLLKGKGHFRNINSSVYRRGLQGVTENTDKRLWADEMYKWNQSLHSLLQSSKIDIDKTIFRTRNQANYYVAFIDGFANKKYDVAIMMFIKAFYFSPRLTLSDSIKLLKKKWQ